ncbi:hypothetical protein ES703_73672 [subsurface metagenome]
MTVCRSLDHPPSTRICFFLGFRPGNSCKLPALAVKPGILLIRTALPLPRPRRSRQNTHPKYIVTIPESIASFLESRPFEVNPDLYFLVRIFIRFLSIQANLHLFPHTSGAGYACAEYSQQKSGSRKQSQKKSRPRYSILVSRFSHYRFSLLFAAIR